MGPQRPPMGPQRPLMGPQFPSGPVVQPGAPTGLPPEMAPEGPPSGVPDIPSDIPSDMPAPASKSSILKFVAIGVAVIAGGGLIYYAGSRKPSRGGRGRVTTRIATPSFAAPSTRAWRP